MNAIYTALPLPMEITDKILRINLFEEIRTYDILSIDAWEAILEYHDKSPCVSRLPNSNPISKSFPDPDGEVWSPQYEQGYIFDDIEDNEFTYPSWLRWEIIHDYYPNNPSLPNDPCIKYTN